MSTTISLEIEVDDEYADPDHSTGLNEEGYEALTAFVSGIGVINEGPDLVS